MSDLLVDTDVLIDHLRGAARLERPRGAAIWCSVITRGELLAGPAAQEPAVRRLLASLRSIPVTAEIADAAGLIRRETGIPIPDAMIASTALSADLELRTRNRRHFERVDGLRLGGSLPPA
jgi:predicted nucleic acid-binding protein